MLVSSHRGSIRSAGFSLIELMIAVVIFAFLVMIAGPMYTTYIGNTHIRAAGEALLNGVRLAHADAIKYNAPVRFVLDASTGWTLHAPDPNDGTDVSIQSYTFSEGASQGHGVAQRRSRNLRRARSRHSQRRCQRFVDEDRHHEHHYFDPRALSVIISAIGGTQGGTKLCDPGLSSPDPSAC